MKIEEHHLDAISEFINIGVGKAAQILNDMLETHVLITLPEVNIFPYDKILHIFEATQNQDMSMVQLGFSQDLTGESALLFNQNSASTLVAALTGEETDSPDLDSLKAETLNEVGNIIMNGVMGSIANITKKNLSFSIPQYKEMTMIELLNSLNLGASSQVLAIQSCFTIENFSTEGSILIFFDSDSLAALSKTVDQLLNE